MWQLQVSSATIIYNLDFAVKFLETTILLYQAGRMLANSSCGGYQSTMYQVKSVTMEDATWKSPTSESPKFSNASSSVWSSAEPAKFKCWVRKFYPCMKHRCFFPCGSARCLRSVCPTCQTRNSWFPGRQDECQKCETF